MKKLFLLSIATITGVSAFAQSQNSVVFTKQATAPVLGEQIVGTRVLPVTPRHNDKTTATNSEWFSYIDLMYSTTKGKRYAGSVAPDSNIAITYSNGTFNVHLHGVGLSFDPTDSVFRGGDKNGHTNAGDVANFDFVPSFAVYQGNAYTVDSISFPFKYIRHDNTVSNDSVFLDVFKVKRAGLTASGQTQGTGMVTFTTSQQSAATLIVNRINAMPDSVAPVGATHFRVAKQMDQAFANDTLTTGWNTWGTNGIQISPALSMDAGDLMVVYISTKMGKTWPLGTNGTAANYVFTNTYDLTGGAPGQSGGSALTGLISTNETTYQVPGSFKPGGHNMAIPSIDYASDGQQIDVAVKVTCPSCVPLSVRNVNTNVFSTSAYPNPATDAVTISFNQKAAVNATVSISNAVGQVLGSQNVGATNSGTATFSTSNLANGLYFYTVESNGQRTTNRFVVAH